MPDGLTDAVGGPYQPPVEGGDASGIVDDANDVYLALHKGPILELA